MPPETSPIQTDVVYASRPTGDLRLDLYLPANAKPPVPVILGITGGGWRNCDRKGPPRFLVEAGFAMACLDYRVSSIAPAPANIQDCKTAVRWVRAHAAEYGLDPRRVGAYGASAGGHLTALLGLSAGAAALDYPGEPGPCDVRAACAVCGPADLSRIDAPALRAKFPLLHEVTELYLGGPVAERLDLARRVSPRTYVRRNSPPMLLVHGEADAIVPVEESMLLHDALKAAGAPVDLMLVKGEGHSWLQSFSAGRITAFFRQTLDVGEPT